MHARISNWWIKYNRASVAEKFEKLDHKMQLHCVQKKSSHSRFLLLPCEATRSAVLLWQVVRPSVRLFV